MTEDSSKTKEISFGDDFGDVAVKVNGVRIEVRTDGHVSAYTHKDVDAYTNGAVHVHPAVNDDLKSRPIVSTAPKPGDRMPDGTVYAGISPDTGKAMYTTHADVPPVTLTFNEAAECAKLLNAQKYLGHDDWRVPTKRELNVLFDHRAAVGGFKELARLPAGWYWTSSRDIDGKPERQRFTDGRQGFDDCDYVSSLRCVRG